MHARGELGVDEEHVRLRVAVPQVDPLVWGRQRGVGGGRAVGQGGGRQGCVWARTISERLKVASSSGVRSSSALPRERCGIDT